MKIDVRHIVGAGVAVGLILIFSPLWLGGNILAGDDLLDYFYPMEHYLHTNLVKGEVPLWNPYTFSGTPFIANMQVGIFYPVHFPLRWLKPEAFFPVSIFIHIIISYIGMTACARIFGLNKFGAAFAGLAWAGSGALLPKMLGGQMPVIFSAAWMPIVIMLWVRLFKTGKMKTGVFLGLAMALQFLAGSVQIFYMTFLTGLFCFLFFILKEYISDRSLKKSGKKVLVSIFSVIIFLGLVSVQLLMTYQWIKLSFTRSAGLDIGTVLRGAWSIEYLNLFIIPDRFFSGFAMKRFDFPTMPGFWEVCPYFGLISLMAIPFAGIGIRKKTETSQGSSKMDKGLLLLVIICFMTLLTSMGLAFPFKLGWYFIPGFNMFRVPARWIMVTIWAGCILAGSGASVWADEKVDTGVKRFRFTQNTMTVLTGLVFIYILYFIIFHIIFPQSIKNGLTASFYFLIFYARLWFFAFACILLILLYKRGKLGGKIFKIGILTLVGIELLIFAFQSPPVITKEEWQAKVEPTPAMVEDINKDSRVLCTDAGFVNSAFIRNHNIYHGYETIRGYDPVVYGRYVRYVNMMTGRPADASVGGMLNVPGIKNINMARRLGIGTIIDRDKTRRDFHTRAVPMPEPWPKCRLAKNVIQPENDLGEKWLDYINEGEYNGKPLNNQDTVLLNLKISYHGKPRTKVEADRIEVLSQSSDEQILEVTTVKDSVLVTNDLYYPGWKVTVDGKRARLLRADYLFRGVALKAGSHRVHFSFQPALLKFGTWITIMSILICIVILLTDAIREKRKAEEAEIV